MSYFESKYTGEQIEVLLDRAGNLNMVEANLTDAPVGNLVSIKIGGRQYLIPVYSDVKVNGEGTPTATATSITIDGITYAIPQGGGGGTPTDKYIHTIKLTWQSTHTAVLQYISTSAEPVTNDVKFASFLRTMSGSNYVDYSVPFSYISGHPDRPTAVYEILVFSSSREAWIFDTTFEDVAYSDTVILL